MKEVSAQELQRGIQPTNGFIVTQNLSDLSVCSGKHSPKVAHVETEEPENRSDHLFSVLNVVKDIKGAISDFSHCQQREGFVTKC